MTVDGQARQAAGELRSSVARSVSVEVSRRELSSRLRRRRLEHGALTVLCVAAVAAVAAVAVRPSPHQALPAGIPTVVPSASPASDCLFTVTCREGIYRAALSVPTTFSPSGVLDVGSDTASVLDLDEPNDVYGLTVVARPRAADGVSALATGVGMAPQDLAAWLDTRPDLVVQRRADATVGGRPAIVLDVTPSAEASFTEGCLAGQNSCLPLFAVEAPAGSPTQVWIGRAQTVRVMLLDVPDAGTVAVLVRDSTTSGYAPAVAMAQVADVLASLAFGTS